MIKYFSSVMSVRLSDQCSLLMISFFSHISTWNCIYSLFEKISRLHTIPTSVSKVFPLYLKINITYRVYKLSCQLFSQVLSEYHLSLLSLDMDIEDMHLPGILKITGCWTKSFCRREVVELSQFWERRIHVLYEIHHLFG
jgi:hypothetical protein